MNPIKIFAIAVMILGSLAFLLLPVSSCAPDGHMLGQPQRKKIPVIFDTDIGDDIDDTWALAMLLRSPEFDIKLITTGVGDTSAKAKIVAKMLEVAGRTDIPIGIGLPCGDMNKGHRQDQWVSSYKLSSYPGTIHQDGVQALIDTVMDSPELITIIAVGPLPNVSAALEREPRIAEKAQFIGMHGSVRRGYDGKHQVDKEYNVVTFVKAAQKVFTADWDMTITPLDTCGIVRLEGAKYKKVFESDKPLARAVIANYRAWTKSQGWEEAEVNTASSTLYDTVGVYLAISTELVRMERLPILVTDDGYTAIDDKGKTVDCATKWKDLDAFEDLLVGRLTK
jgi:inosine-uridine nucleoside N-ribohydrolase